MGVGWLGFGLSVFVVFLVLLYVVTKDSQGSTAAADRVVTAIVVTGALVLLVPLVWILGYVVVKGVEALRLSFFIHDQRGITPTMPATAGGGSHAIVGTLETVGLALLWSLPLAVAAAVFLNESRSKWRRPVRIFVDAMSGLPSVLAGLFIYATLILPYAKKVNVFGTYIFSFNGFMASLALALIMVPTITRTVEVVLRLVPDGLREASLALGSSKARTTWSVVLPTARTGITTAVILGIARAVGRDRAAAVHRVRLRPHEQQPVQRSPGEPPALRVPQHQEARPLGGVARLRRRAGADAHRARALRPGALHRP